MKALEHFQENRSKYYVAFLILVTIVILTKAINQGDFWFPDAPRHAMDGVFVLDFIKDFPILHIYDYTIQYYAKYPALGIGYYPPFFALVEAGFYALFGISVVSARLTVLFFALVAVIFWFRLVKLIFDERIAFYSSFLFITTPFIVKWSRETMLEMPLLAMVILSVYFFYNFIELNKPRHKYYLILATVAAIYTKQTAVFLIPLFFLYLIFTKKHKRLLERQVILTSLTLLLLVLPLAVLTLKYGEMNLSQSIGSIGDQSRLLSLDYWLFYPKVLRKVLTIPVLILSIASILLIPIKRDHQKSMLFLAWLLGFYLTFSYIRTKEPRYIYSWLPPFILFATLILNEIPWRIKKVSIVTILLIPLCIYQFLLSFNLKKPLIYGYEEAARYILEKQEVIVFFQGSGVGNGNFIFHIRKLDTDRKMVVLRGDKILASFVISPNKSLVEHAKSIDETYAILEAYGSKYLIIEETVDSSINAFKMLGEVLKSKDFIMVSEINTNIHKLKGESLLIYKLNEDISPKRDLIHMRLPIIGVEITVPLKTLFNFYTPSEAIIIPSQESYKGKTK